jgi:hypothetical protein
MPSTRKRRSGSPRAASPASPSAASAIVAAIRTGLSTSMNPAGHHGSPSTTYATHWFVPRATWNSDTMLVVLAADSM